MKRQLGKTDIYVFPVGLGAMPLSIQGRPSEEDSIKVIHASLDSGVNFIDTANVYCLDDNDIGHNEKIIYKALKLKNALDSVIVATKGGLIRPQGRWDVDARPKVLRESCEKSLKALNTDVITLYQLHAPDHKVPFESTIEELAKLKEEGKIKHIGLSNVSNKELSIAQKIVRIESVQNRCSPFYKKDFKNGLVELCKEQNVSYLPYSPVGGGYSHKKVTEYEVFKKLSSKYNTSPYCIILSWLLSKGEHIIPIPGASKINSATDSPKAVNIELDNEDIKIIDSLPDM